MTAFGRSRAVVISSGKWAVYDVAGAGFEPRRRHVISSGVQTVATVALGLLWSNRRCLGRTRAERRRTRGPVQRVLTPVTDIESWTVLGNAGAVVAPLEWYLRLPERVGAVAEHGPRPRDDPEAVVEFLGEVCAGLADVAVEAAARLVASLRARRTT